MILTKEVEVNVIGKTLQHFLDLGYDIPHTTDENKKNHIIGQKYKITIPPQHLLPTSIVLVDVCCDICGAERQLKYRDYCESISCHNYYCCKKCKAIKMKETNLERYGVTCTVHNPDIYQKAIKTWEEKYGINHPLKSSIVRQKIQKTLNENSNTNTSKQQLYLNTIFNGELNHPIDMYSIDIYMVDDNVAIEYDGSGHDLKVKCGRYTQGEFNRREYLKEKVLHDNNIRLIRIKSPRDYLPSDDVIRKLYNDALEYFDNNHHSWRYYYLDDNIFKDAEHKDGQFYNYGVLHNTKYLILGNDIREEVAE